MTAKEHLKIAEENLEKAFLLTAFNQARKGLEEDDLPESLEDAMKNGWRGLSEKYVLQCARSERIKWHARVYFDRILERL